MPIPEANSDAKAQKTPNSPTTNKNAYARIKFGLKIPGFHWALAHGFHKYTDGNVDLKAIINPKLGPEIMRKVLARTLDQLKRLDQRLWRRKRLILLALTLLLIGLDGQFLGTAAPYQPLVITPSAGRHHLTCMTPEGLTDQVRFSVSDPTARN